MIDKETEWREISDDVLICTNDESVQITAGLDYDQGAGNINEGEARALISQLTHWLEHKTFIKEGK